MPSGTADFTELKQLGQGVSGICRLARRNADQRLYALKELDMPTEQVHKRVRATTPTTPTDRPSPRNDCCLAG